MLCVQSESAFPDVTFLSISPLCYEGPHNESWMLSNVMSKTFEIYFHWNYLSTSLSLASVSNIKIDGIAPLVAWPCIHDWFDNSWCVREFVPHKTVEQIFFHYNHPLWLVHFANHEKNMHKQIILVASCPKISSWKPKWFTYAISCHKWQRTSHNGWL